MDGSRNVSIRNRNRKFLRLFTGLADVMAEDVVPSSPVPQFRRNIRMMEQMLGKAVDIREELVESRRNSGILRWMTQANRRKTYRQ